jgi:hypothetical protein
MFVIFTSAPPYNVHFPVVVSALAQFMFLGGLASLGINAKDSEVTGGSIVQPGIPVVTPAQAVVAEAIPSKPAPAAPPLRKW